MKPKTTMGPDFETHATDLSALAQALAKAQQNLILARTLVKQGTNPDAQGILGRELLQVAKFSLLASQWDLSHRHFTEVIAHWHTMGRKRAALMAQMGLAELLRRRLPTNPQHFAQALQLLDELEVQTQQEDLAMYRDFVLHARGLTAMHAGLHDRARQDLHHALELRQTRGQKRLIQETQNVISYLDKL